MELTVVIIILLVLVEGIYRWWLDKQERSQPIVPELAPAPAVHRASRKSSSPVEER
jgi:hypothetical protein